MKGKAEMKLSCDMAMDLAPLYSDGCASKDTREAVREHLAGCGRCRRYFAAVNSEPKVCRVTSVPNAVDYAAVSRRLHRQRIKVRAAMAAALLLAAGVASAVSAEIIYGSGKRSGMREKGS